jgi:hypothetical protein
MTTEIMALAGHLRRKRRVAPPEDRCMMLVLEQQCRKFNTNPNVRGEMLKTIEKLEAKCPMIHAEG